MNPLARLVFELSKLPGIGEKTATRLAYFILNHEGAFAEDLSRALLEAKQKLRTCSQCYNFSENEKCEICLDLQRDTGLICVVERPSDVTPLERTGAYRGHYHVLHGLLSPLDGVGPEHLRMRELLQRLKDNEVKEVIFALNPSVEGEATSLYLTRILSSAGIKTSQVAYGIPFGGTIEFTDRQTLGKALQNRTDLNQNKSSSSP